MMTAFDLAQFEPVDVTVTDILAQRAKVEDFHGLVIP